MPLYRVPKLSIARTPDLPRRRAGPALAVAALACCVFDATAAPGAATCAGLAGVAIANTTITSATYVTAATGHYCEVAATVIPQHDVRVRLPDDWKQRYVQYGGGGFDGSIPNLSTGFGTVGKDPVAYGFVVAASNGGHRSSSFPGASFAADRGLTLSYSVAKIYDTDLVAKALVQAYYGQQARYRYFTGCSNGGKNASVAASNYVDRYDGIIGADGVWGHADDNVGGADMPGLTSKWSQTLQVGALSSTKAAALYAKTVQACDALDGAVDGIVSNVNACSATSVAQSLRCKGAEDGSCLTDADIAKVGAHTSSLMLNNKVLGPAWSPTANMASVGGVGGLASGFLAMAYRSATPIDPLTYNIPEQFDEVKTVLDDVYNMTGDLDGILKYLHKGKKLILFHGWEDPVVPSYVSVNFYNALRKTDFPASLNARLYMAPGVQHCAGGVGADSTDLLNVMAKWVEERVEPGSPANPANAWKIGSPTGPADISGAAFSRPLCPYPQFPFYFGFRDPKLAANHVCMPGPDR